MNFEKWNLGFFANFHIGKLFRVKRLKWIALSLIVRISACQARCLVCCFVWFSHYLLSPEISLFTHRCNNSHSFKSPVQDTKPKRRLDGQNMIRLKYILFKKFEKSRDAGFLFITVCILQSVYLRCEQINFVCYWFLIWTYRSSERTRNVSNINTDFYCFV